MGFFEKHNGSEKLDQIEEEAGCRDVDLLHFWRKIDQWGILDTEKDKNVKYVWAFLKFDPDTFTVNLTKFEEYFGTISRENQVNKVNEISSALSSVIKGLKNKKKHLREADSFEDHYDFVIKNGVKIVKGSVQELIHEFNDLIHTPEGEEKIQEAFKSQKTKDGEINQRMFGSVWEDLDMHPTKAQLKQLFEFIDKDKDMHITYKELKKYLESYNLKLNLKSSVLKEISPRSGILKLFTILTHKNKLTDKDFFKLGCKSILTSEHACLIRLEQIVLEMKKKNQEMFFDTDFGPKDDDDEANHKLALFRNGECASFLPYSEDVKWYGPEIYAEGEWKFIDGGASFNEVMQGGLGD